VSHERCRLHKGALLGIDEKTHGRPDGLHA
jgi:hypothetical protein